MYTSIRPGKVWLDTDGNRIQAHGGTIFYENETYFWIGENKDHTTGKDEIWTWGVKIYSSHDLYNWKYEGYLLEPDTNDKLSCLHPAKMLDRPHMLYNDKTKKYVLWLKYCDGAHYSIWISDRLMGKYELVNAHYRPFDVDCGDFDLAKDEKTGDAYLYWEVNHRDVWGVKLSADYTSAEGNYVKIYENILPPFTREGIAHVEHKGKHYIFSSGMTSYVPNPSETAVSETWLGEYRVLGNPHINDESGASFNSQISHILKVQGKDLIIAAADRWVPDKLMTKELTDTLSRAVRSHYDKSVTVTQEEKMMCYPLLKCLQGGKIDTSIADYVWLPIEFEKEMPVIRWHDQWTV